MKTVYTRCEGMIYSPDTIACPRFDEDAMLALDNAGAALDDARLTI
jgi:hypothetical protein